jgi:uncharacterized protein (DUF983 family)
MWCSKVTPQGEAAAWDMGRVNPFLAGLLGRCPHCGRSPLFSGFLTVRPVCLGCGFDLSKADAGDGPAVFIILIAGFLCAFGALAFDLSLHPPIWVDFAVWLPLAALLSIGLIRPFKGVLIALQFHNKAAEARRDP